MKKPKQTIGTRGLLRKQTHYAQYSRFFEAWKHTWCNKSCEHWCLKIHLTYSIHVRALGTKLNV
jgi:hypothetical protein